MGYVRLESRVQKAAIAAAVEPTRIDTTPNMDDRLKKVFDNADVDSITQLLTSIFHDDAYRYQIEKSDEGYRVRDNGTEWRDAKIEDRVESIPYIHLAQMVSDYLTDIMDRKGITQKQLNEQVYRHVRTRKVTTNNWLSDLKTNAHPQNYTPSKNRSAFAKKQWKYLSWVFYSLGVSNREPLIQQLEQKLPDFNYPPEARNPKIRPSIPGKKKSHQRRKKVRTTS